LSEGRRLRHSMERRSNGSDARQFGRLARAFALRRVASPRGPANGCARAAADCPRHVRRDGDGDGGICRPRTARTARHRRAGAQARCRDARPAHTAGGADRPAGVRRSDEPEIGARLFLSARTIKWHLRKVFASSASAPVESCAPHFRRQAQRPCRPSNRRLARHRISRSSDSWPWLPQRCWAAALRKAYSKSPLLRAASVRACQPNSPPAGLPQWFVHRLRSALAEARQAVGGSYGHVCFGSGVGSLSALRDGLVRGLPGWNSGRDCERKKLAGRPGELGPAACS
jgi:hypothetical protein